MGVFSEIRLNRAKVCSNPNGGQSPLRQGGQSPLKQGAMQPAHLVSAQGNEVTEVDIQSKEQDGAPGNWQQYLRSENRQLKVRSYLRGASKNAFIVRIDKLNESFVQHFYNLSGVLKKNQEIYQVRLPRENLSKYLLQRYNIPSQVNRLLEYLEVPATLTLNQFKLVFENISTWDCDELLFMLFFILDVN